MDYAIDTQELGKVFSGDVHAVDGLTMKVEKGCVYGLIGRNGAGKTTTIRMLAGVMRPTRGQARLLGSDMATATARERTRFAYVSQAQELHRWMTLAELCQYMAFFYPAWDEDYARNMAQRFDLPRDRPVGLLSGGELRKVAILLAFATRPEVLLLDEPAAGLDPIARRELVGEIIDVIAGAHVSTILFSTHIVTDLERVADTIGIMDKGRLLMSENLDTLKSRTRRIQVIFDKGDAPADFTIPGAVRIDRSGPVVTAIVQLDEENPLESLHAMDNVRVQEYPLGLEEAFIELLGTPTNGNGKKGEAQ